MEEKNFRYQPVRPVETYGEADPLLTVIIDEFAAELPLSSVINQAFVASAVHSGLRYAQVLEPARTNKKANQAHRLALAILSDAVNNQLSVEDLATELDTTPEDILQKTEEGYELVEDMSEQQYNALKLYYRYFLRAGQNEEADEPAISAKEREQILFAQGGNKDARQAIEHKYTEILEEVVDNVRPDLPLSDLSAIAERALQDLINSANLLSSISFEDQLRTTLAARIRRFETVASEAGHYGMSSLHTDVVEFQDVMDTEIVHPKPVHMDRTVQVILSAVKDYALDHFKGPKDQVEQGGLTIRRAQTQKAERQRKVETVTEALKNHVAAILHTAGVMYKEDYVVFDVTELPTRQLANFVAQTMTVVAIRLPVDKVTKGMAERLQQSGYVPDVASSQPEHS